MTVPLSFADRAFQEPEERSADVNSRIHSFRELKNAYYMPAIILTCLYEALSVGGRDDAPTRAIPGIFDGEDHSGERGELQACGTLLPAVPQFTKI